MTTPPSPAPDLVLLGTCGGAHGIRGEVRVRSFTAEPEEIGAYGPLRDADGRVFTVQSARQQKNVVVVRFREITDRNAAERLNGVELFVPREALPDEGEDEFYLSDLVGLVARLTTGEVVGEIVGFHDFGAGDILEIAPEAGASLMIPFTQAAVPEVDVELGFLVVDPVPAGLRDVVEVKDAEAGDD